MKQEEVIMTNGKLGAALVTACCLLSSGCDKMLQVSTSGNGGCESTSQPTSPTSCGNGLYESVDPPVFHPFYVNGMVKDDLLEVALTSEPSPRRGQYVLFLPPDSLVPIRYTAQVRMRSTPDDPSVTAIVSAWPSTDGYKVVPVNDTDIGAVIVKNGQSVQIPDPKSTRKYFVDSSFSYIKFQARYERAVPGERTKRELVTSYGWIVVDYRW